MARSLPLDSQSVTGNVIIAQSSDSIKAGKGPNRGVLSYRFRTAESSLITFATSRLMFPGQMYGRRLTMWYKWVLG